MRTRTLLYLTATFLLLCWPALAQQPAVSIRSGANDPATCKENTLNIFKNTTSHTLKHCSALNTWTALGTGAGTVTSVSVVTANGVSGSVATATTTPAITLTLGAITPTTVQTSGNVGLGTAPSGTSGLFLDALAPSNTVSLLQARSTDVSGVNAAATLRGTADAAVISMSAHGTGQTATRYGVTIGGYSELVVSGGNGLLLGTTGATPIVIGTNNATNISIASGGATTFSNAIIPSQTIGITGTTTNNNANALAVGEYQTGSTAANTTPLTTGTSINVGAGTNFTLTAGDWDCEGVINFTFGATTSVTNLSGGFSTTTGTLGAQDTFFDLETAANVMTAAKVAAYVVPAQRFSLSGTTNIFLVTQAAFTASTASAGGTYRCRRVR